MKLVFEVDFEHCFSDIEEESINDSILNHIKSSAGWAAREALKNDEAFTKMIEEKTEALLVTEIESVITGSLKGILTKVISKQVNQLIKGNKKVKDAVVARIVSSIE